MSPSVRPSQRSRAPGKCFEMKHENVVGRIKNIYRVGAVPRDGRTTKLKVDPSIRGSRKAALVWVIEKNYWWPGFLAKSGIRGIRLRNVSCSGTWAKPRNSTVGYGYSIMVTHETPIQSRFGSRETPSIHDYCILTIILLVGCSRRFVRV